MAVLRIFSAGLVGIALQILAGFTVEGPRGGTDNAVASLKLSPRWELTGGSLVENGERGLGGGLEYVIDDSICALRFTDGTTCEQARAAIAGALQEWRSGHPAIQFTDVTGQIEPATPLAELSPGGQGAEIDFLAATPEQFAPFRNPSVAGYTMFYERAVGAIRLTNGRFGSAVSRLESADVRFNAARCYYLDPAQARSNCIHLPSLALHEIAHALGIAHPEENIARNLDSDNDPANPITIDCMDPTRGLFAAPEINGAAVAIGRDVQGPGRWHRGLTYDDVAARDALYPHCSISPRARWSGAWGAFARGASGEQGRASGLGDRYAALDTALAACRKQSRADCQVIASFNDCFAFAEGRGAAAHASSPRSDLARVNAVIACTQAGGKDCRVTSDFCAFE